MLELAGYSELEVIGSGGFSIVYRARQARFNRLVAIKVLNVPAFDADTERRFLRECQIAGGVSNHPNIVTLHDAGFAANGQPYLVFEYMNGGSLAARIAQHGGLPVPEVSRTAAKLAGALAAIHTSGVLHRDVKPSNVLLSAYEEPCLADFGISFVQSTLHATSMTSSLTPLFSSPEVVDGEPASTASDVYSLGATLYAALSGHAPFAPSPGESVSRTLLRIMHDPVPPLDRADLPPAFTQLLESMLHRDPSARPPAQTVADLLSPGPAGPDLDLTVRRGPAGAWAGGPGRLQGTEPATVVRTGQPDQDPVAPVPPARRRALPPLPTIGAVVAAAALAAGLTVALVGSGHSDRLTLSQTGATVTSTTDVVPAPTVPPSTSTTTAPAPTTTPAPVTTVTTTPPPTAVSDPTSAELARDATLAQPLLNHWVAQLGAYHSPSGALAALQTARSTYSSALLINSSDYISKTPGYLDVILGVPFDDSTAAVSWCQSAGLTPSTCFAVYLSHDTPFSSSTYKSW